MVIFHGLVSTFQFRFKLCFIIRSSACYISFMVALSIGTRHFRHIQLVAKLIVEHHFVAMCSY